MFSVLSTVLKKYSVTYQQRSCLHNFLPVMSRNRILGASFLNRMYEKNVQNIKPMKIIVFQDTWHIYKY